ncbi:MAG: DUF881 domain-containing protein [Actinomycetota bacterium]
MAQRPSRIAAAAAIALFGFFAAMAAVQSREAPARSLRRLELVDLIEDQDVRVRALQAEVRRLERELAKLRPAVAAAEAHDILSVVGELSRLGGGSVVGPGVLVVLDDSSASRSPSGDPNDLVVHEQDIQTVVNALWAAGAEAIALDGERLTSGSAVRCAGNTLLLHGAVHSPPYEISAIGDPRRIETSLPSQPGMIRLLDAVETFGIGLQIEARSVRIAARTGVAPLTHARPAA